MFKIYGDKQYFYQWDLNQKLIIEDESITEVHFCNRTDGNALICEVYVEDGQRLANVPNILLQEDWSIKAYAVCDNCTMYSFTFIIMPRSKPEEYIYTETEVRNYEVYEDRLKALEAVDLSVYATEQYVDKAIDAIPNVDLSGYATEDYVNKAVDNVEVDLSPYAKKEDIEGLATESYVDEALSNIDVSGGSVQPDWEQNDSTAADYIKNRICYESVGMIDRVPITLDGECVEADGVSAYRLNANLNREIVLSGVTLHLSDGSSLSDFEGDYAGTTSIIEELDENCCMVIILGMIIAVVTEVDNYDIDGIKFGRAGVWLMEFPQELIGLELEFRAGAVEGLKINKIPQKYIPSLPYVSSAEFDGKYLTITEFNEHARNEVGVKNSSGGEKFNSATEASGNDSHAEGQRTKATSQAAHAEGLETTASGAYSHAEGYQTTASGASSHAEGYQTTASENQSHAEGWGSIASGQNSHAEGYFCVAEKSSSHAEGSNTHAGVEGQHVQGRYNIINRQTDSIKFAHIVGNGTNAQRSNAHTLDWDGNAWYAGSIEGTAIILTSPSAKRFKITVDDSGNLTATAL